MKTFIVRYTSLEFDHKSFNIALKSFPLLTELELLSCHTVDDHILQIIIRNCRGLKILKLISCEISDSGIVGEIIDEAGNNGLPLSVLSHLEVLSLSKCSKITNMSLCHSFKFKSLKGLDLTGLDKITEEGVSQMTRECPYIEKLKLDGCKSLTNDAIDLITRNLKLLKILYLNQCPHLTEICLSEIVDRCKNIQVSVICYTVSLFVIIILCFYFLHTNSEWKLCCPHFLKVGAQFITSRWESFTLCIVRAKVI